MSKPKRATIKSLEEFLREITKFSEQHLMLFRGQSDSSWEVTSGAYRRTKGEDLISYNANLLERARRYRQEVKENISDIELLAELQHGGEATSLIDFTSNALIALWFACQGTDKDGKVFCLNTVDIERFLELSSADEEKPIKDILNLNIRTEEPSESQKVSITNNIEFGKWKPPLTNNRILKQDSVFVFNALGKIDESEFKKIIIIEREAKKEILKQLRIVSNLTEDSISDTSITITSLKEFLEIIEKFSEQDSVLFRGQSNSEWGVISSAYRRTKGKDFIKYNITLLNQAKYYQQEIEKNISDIALLADLQHKGAATNLIDFTSNALIALWFACQETEKDLDKKAIENGKVFCLDTADADKFLELESDEATKSIKEIFSSATRVKFRKWKPPLMSNRILKQDSVFIFSTSGEIGAKNFRKIITIKQEAKQEILKQLRTVSNLTEETIFPDLQRFVKNNEVNKPLPSTDSDNTLQSAEKLFYLALEAHQQGDYDKAIEHYTEAIKLNPNYARAHNNRGVAYYNTKDFKYAMVDYTEAIRLNPNFFQAYNNRGSVYYAKKQYDKAIKEYDEAIKLNPNYARAYYNRGVTYALTRRYNKAIEDYTRVIELNPNNAEAYYIRGIAYSAKGKYNKAIEDYTKAVELNPNNTEAYYVRGIAYNAKGEYDKGIADFSKAIELNPNFKR